MKKISIRCIIIFSILLVILLFTFLILYLFGGGKESIEYDNLYKDLSDRVTIISGDTGAENEESAVLTLGQFYNDVNFDRRIDFDYLLSVNSDVASWLYIPNTSIDYPVMQEQRVEEYYYLYRDYTRSYATGGSLLIPASPLGADDAHTLIFGHHMQYYNLAFTELPGKYDDADYAAENPYAYLYYPDRIERWKVWCGVSSDKWDKIYEIPYTLGSDAYGDLLTSVQDKALYEVSEAPDKSVRTLVLSTCNGRAGGSIRFYVVLTKDLSVEI